MINLRQEKMEEMRQDMLIEQKLRIDDDYFYDYLVANTDTDDMTKIICKMYDREDQINYWIELLKEK